MEAIAEQNSVYLDEFAARGRSAEPQWLAERRRAAIQDFENQGFPNRRVEAWKNLNLHPLTQTHFSAAERAGTIEGDPSVLGQAADVYRAVFVDGFFDAERSSLPEGAVAAPLAQAKDEMEGRLASLADTRHHPFAALNTAFFADGLAIRLAKGRALDKPLVMVFAASAEAGERAMYPRVLVDAAEGSSATILQVYTGPDGTPYLNCPVTEIAVGANARIAMYELQEEGVDGFHFGVVHAELQRDARFRFHGLAAGGRIARTDIHADLRGPGCEAELDGLYLVGDGQASDYHTWVRHETEHGTSRQVFKGVLAGKSESVFDGMVHVAKGAQKTSAEQENRNLLMSRRALAHSNPRLEIYADDVKCSHGSTAGELDKDAVFYLRSRGIGEQDARGVLIFAFANEMLNAVEPEFLRDHEREALFRFLPGDETVRGLV